jgi:hypothetical protein
MKLGLIFLISFSAFANWHVKFNQKGKKVEVVDVQITKRQIQKKFITIKSLPLYLSEELDLDSPTYKEMIFQESHLPSIFRSHLRKKKSEPKNWPGSEVRTLVNQGPDNNRITLTILGDGYTNAEKEKFFDDALRLTNDLFKVQTFNSYLKLFNVHAVFTPSKDSGITDRVRKDTAFGLYRAPKGSKRGILPGNRGALERALRLAPATADYPIVVANDNFYGGLGGRYAITTRSLTSGSMVLRHELGHNFGNVGEEYDGGQVYQGANFSRSKNLPWKHWVDGQVEYHRALNLGGEYLWVSLRNPYEYEFNFPEQNQSFRYKVGIDLSSVGWASANEVSIYIDGQKVPYKGLYTKDRSFFEVLFNKPIKPGKHKLVIKENVADGDNVLAYFRVYAYPQTYNFSAEKIGGFVNYRDGGSVVGYRPTHKMCLMRDMRSPYFCPVDIENMWKRFLNVVDLIDSVQVEDIEVGTLVTLNRPRLVGTKVYWYKKNGSQYEEVKQLRDRNKWSVDPGVGGDFAVKVIFKTDEVRNYNDRFETIRKFSI